MRTFPLLLAATLLAPLSVAQTKINDAVRKKNGEVVKGIEVTEFLLTGVRAKRGADAIEIQAHQVADVTWSDLPDAFVAGKTAMDRGDFRGAAQLFGDVKSERALVKADAEFFKLKCAIAAIGADKAAATTDAENMKSWLAANVNHWRTPEAMLLAGRALRLAGTGGTAATLLRELDDRATREVFGAVWIARTKAELALTLLADGKAGEARAAFQAAGSAAGSALATPSADDAELRALKTLAKVGEGETFLTDKEFDKAESFFHALVSSNEAELVAAGHAGEGEAIFMKAAAANKADDIRRAQIALATASVLDVQGGESSAKANYYLGRCLLALGPDREGDSFKARANAYFQVVVSSYPTSRWAAQAKLEQTK